MAIKRDKVQAGMQLYDRHRYRAGNTTMRALGEWPVDIAEVQERGCVVRWNGNSPRFWAWRQIEKLYTWSMYDDTEAEITKGFGGVSGCKRLPKAERDRRKAERNAS